MWLLKKNPNAKAVHQQDNAGSAPDLQVVDKQHDVHLRDDVGRAPDLKVMDKQDDVLWNEIDSLQVEEEGRNRGYSLHSSETDLQNQCLVNDMQVRATAEDPTALELRQYRYELQSFEEKAEYDKLQLKDEVEDYNMRQYRITAFELRQYRSELESFEEKTEHEKLQLKDEVEDFKRELACVEKHAENDDYKAAERISEQSRELVQLHEELRSSKAQLVEEQQRCLQRLSDEMDEVDEISARVEVDETAGLSLAKELHESELEVEAMRVQHQELLICATQLEEANQKTADKTRHLEEADVISKAEKEIVQERLSKAELMEELHKSYQHVMDYELDIKKMQQHAFTSEAHLEELECLFKEQHLEQTDESNRQLSKEILRYEAELAEHHEHFQQELKSQRARHQQQIDQREAQNVLLSEQTAQNELEIDELLGSVAHQETMYQSEVRYLANEAREGSRREVAVSEIETSAERDREKHEMAVLQIERAAERRLEQADESHRRISQESMKCEAQNAVLVEQAAKFELELEVQHNYFLHEMQSQRAQHQQQIERYKVVVDGLTQDVTNLETLRADDSMSHSRVGEECHAELEKQRRGFEELLQVHRSEFDQQMNLSQNKMLEVTDDGERHECLLAEKTLQYQAELQEQQAHHQEQITYYEARNAVLVKQVAENEFGTDKLQEDLMVAEKYKADLEELRTQTALDQVLFDERKKRYQAVIEELTQDVAKLEILRKEDYEKYQADLEESRSDSPSMKQYPQERIPAQKYELSPPVKQYQVQGAVPIVKSRRTKSRFENL